MIGVNFDEKASDFFLFDNLVEVIAEVVHNDVEILRLPFIGEETICHDQVIRVLQHFQYLVLSIFVLLVLQDLFDRYPLSSEPVSAEIHHSKSSLTCHALDLVL